MIIDAIKRKIFDFFNYDVSFNYKKFIKCGGMIGQNCEVWPDVEFGSEPYLITIGDNVRITSGVRFVTHDGGVWVLRNNPGLEDIDVFGKIVIGNNVHIGWNSIIMPNVVIGNNVVIGAGSVVTHDIPDNTIVGGVPAKVIKSLAEYKEKVELNGIHTKNLTWKEKREYLESEKTMHE